MSYTILARKWRPQIFEEVVGQEHVVKTLQNALESSRITHAYIFTGARGVGKTTIARILAKALNCEKGPARNPCNSCQTCMEITKGSSVDVMEIDGASNTGVDDVRELRENVRYTPSKSRYKVYIIDEVHMLSVSAFNALLKTLEEPPHHVVFIFATTEPHKIPLTILSRCQRFDFRRIPLSIIKNHLKKIAEIEGIEIEDKGIMLIAEEADGSMRDAQSMLDQIASSMGTRISEKNVRDVLGLMDQTLIHDVVKAIIKKDAEECIKIVEKAYGFGYDEKRFWQEIIGYFRNIILVKTIDAPEGIVDLSREDIGSLRGAIKDVSLEELYWILQSLINGFEDLNRVIYPRLALEVTLLKLVSLPPLLSIKGLFQRLDDLERRIGSAKTLHTINEEDSVSVHSSFRKNLGSGRYIGSEPIGDSKERNGEDGHVVEKGDSKKEDVTDLPWKGFLAFVKGKRPPLHSHLTYGKPLYFGQGCLSIGIKRGIHHDYLSERETIDYLERLSREFFKRPLRVKIAEINEEKTTISARNIKDKEDSFVRDVIEIFGGKVCNHIEMKDRN